ncbi:hypothetical protein [Niastella populi]|uniref:Uncharacterized protein n=1 Tax=Niastella populi TaxID=550983 RepID=A0A1V9FEG9_9BACT|nr:hypothetical protein [Niastella populi]OQP56759.1 hypothetical protein A4R26_25240 [Niastella populi]
MKPVILFLLTSISVSLYSQQTGTPGFLTQIGRSTDGSVRVCLLVDNNGDGKELFIYRNGKSWDTLSIAREGDSYIGDTCFIQTVQIDKKGLKEVVLSWSTQFSHSYGGSPGGSFSNKFTKHEIWNLNTGKKLFAAQSVYYNEEHTGFYSGTYSSDLRTRKVTCSYRYTFSVTNEGKVVISRLQVNNSVMYDNETVNRIKEEKNACSFSMPDHQPGIYVLRGQQFIRAEK